MGDYFRPLRRKIGCITLLLACVFTAGWVRSLKDTKDILCVPIGQHTFEYFHSLNGAIWCFHLHNTVETDVTFFKEHYRGWNRRPVMSGARVDRVAKYGPFLFRNESTYAARGFSLRIPYWSIVIPLTLLSAWLLLSKPRKPMSVTPSPADAQADSKTISGRSEN